MQGEQDLPFLDDEITKLPADIRADLAERGRRDLFFFSRAVMGMPDLTVDCHGPLCAMADLNSSQFKLFLMPRDHLKTSLLTISGSMQRVVRNVEERMLIGNESATNAERMLRSIRQHAEGNRVFRALYSSIIPKDVRKVRWNDSELDFAREGHWPEPTIDSIGMTGAVTSRHYTHITYDDPISEEAVKSEKVMTDTIARMSASLSLLTDPSKHTIWLVGTRWALHDVYSVWMNTFGDKLARIIRAAIEDDEPIWPERFSMDVLALKRAQMGEYKFSCLMMNNPRNVELQDLNVDDFRFWQFIEDGTAVRLFDNLGQPIDEWPLDKLDVTCTVDPVPPDTVMGDRNAVTTVGVTPKNQAIVLDAWGKRCNPLQLVEKLFDVKKRFKPRVFGIEKATYQMALKYFIGRLAEQEGMYLNIVPVKPGGKDKPHIRGLQPLMATGRLYIHPSQHILRNEAADYPLGEHDDVLDSLALHLQLFRGQMSLERWSKYQESEQALMRRLQNPDLDRGVKMKPNGGFDFEDDIDDIDPEDIAAKHNAPSWREVIMG